MLVHDHSKFMDVIDLARGIDIPGYTAQIDTGTRHLLSLALRAIAGDLGASPLETLSTSRSFEYLRLRGFLAEEKFKTLISRVPAYAVIQVFMEEGKNLPTDDPNLSERILSVLASYPQTACPPRWDGEMYNSPHLLAALIDTGYGILSCNSLSLSPCAARTFLAEAAEMSSAVSLFSTGLMTETEAEEYTRVLFQLYECVLAENPKLSTIESLPALEIAGSDYVRQRITL